MGKYELCDDIACLDELLKNPLDSNWRSERSARRRRFDPAMILRAPAFEK